MDIYEKIKYVRDVYKISQKEFAKVLDVTQTTISNYEKRDRKPDFDTLNNLITKFNVNPNWIFFNEEPPFYGKVNYDITATTKEVIEDFCSFFTPEEVENILKKTFIDQIIDVVANASYDDTTILAKFLAKLNIDNSSRFSPYLFLYYVLRYVADNPHELDLITSYQDYLIDLVKRYNVITFKNNPGFTFPLKRQVEAAILEYLSEKECEIIIKNYKDVLENIESKMTPLIRRGHRKVNTKDLFPK